MKKRIICGTGIVVGIASLLGLIYILCIIDEPLKDDIYFDDYKTP